MKKKSVEKESENLPLGDDTKPKKLQRNTLRSREKQQKKSILDLLGRGESDRSNDGLSLKRNNSFRESFVFSLIKALLLVVILIVLMYLIRPHSAHIYMNIENTTQLTPAMDSFFYASSVDCYDIKKQMIIFSADTEMVIKGDLTVNGIHDPNEIIVLQPSVVSNKTPNISFFLEGDFNRVSLDEVGVSNNNYYADRIIVFDFDYLRLGISNPDICSVHVENTGDHTKDRVIDPTKDQIAVSDSLSFGEVEITLRNASQGDTKKSVLTYFDCGFIEARHVSLYHATVTGNASISYTPTANEYPLKVQEVRFENTSNHDLNLVITNPSTSEGTLFGYITDGSISLFSIFPSLRIWFFSNALLAPTTLLTVILTAISIFVKNKKKEE